MDRLTVRSYLAAILESNAEHRKQAEKKLKQIQDQPGFVQLLIEILHEEQEPSIRLSTAIYLKNRVNRAWSRTEAYPDQLLIPADEKDHVRSRILPALAAFSCLGPVRIQLISIIQRILTIDFPDGWPGYIDFTMELLNTNDRVSVLTGLECLLAVARTYRFKATEAAGRAVFDSIVELSFPRLLDVCKELLTQESDEAAEMCHLALKIYKNATWLEICQFLRQRPNLLSWCEILLQIVAKPLPAQVMAEEDLGTREKHHWVKSKKWASYVLNRHYLRFGCPSQLSPARAHKEPDMQFAREFSDLVAPEMLRHYLAEVEKWVGKTIWMGQPCLANILVFLDDCVTPKEMWGHLRPHVVNLVTHLVFPMMCLTPVDIDKFDDEPEEYLHRKLNYFEEISAPDVAATNFLVRLTKSRRKIVFDILKFVNSVVCAYDYHTTTAAAAAAAAAAPQTPAQQIVAQQAAAAAAAAAASPYANPIAKEGALRMIGIMAPVLLAKNSPIAGQVEYFLVRYVLPEFASAHGYLRARACDTMEKFEQLDWTDEANLLVVYHHIVGCLSDQKLPVQVTAALSLQPLIRHEAVRLLMRENIATIMQQFLKMSSLVDIDGLANVMEDFVEVFSDELNPFAVALSEQLRDNYLRLVDAVLTHNKDLQPGEDGDPAAAMDEDTRTDFVDEKSITALGVLQTIGTLILTLESSPDVLGHIESVLMPLIRVTLENRLYDLYNEIFEIIDSCTFSAKKISDTMWQAFELLYDTFRAGGELYLEDMMPALDNFVQFGAAALAGRPEYVHSLYTIVSRISNDVASGGVDKVCACKLAEVMMLCLRGSIDKYVAGFIAAAMGVLFHSPVKVKLVRVHLMEMVINAIYYNPVLALGVLESKGWAADFFSLWLNSIQSFTRVHDIKLCLIAIAGLLRLSPEQIPPSVVTGYILLLPGAIELFKNLPRALRNREEAMKDDMQLSSGLIDFDSEEWDEDDVNWDPEHGSDTGMAEPDSTNAADNVADGPEETDISYLDFLNAEADKFGPHIDPEDEDLGEESTIRDTPLDKIDPYKVFRDALFHMQRDQPQLYQRLASSISTEQTELLQNVICVADEQGLVDGVPASFANNNIHRPAPPDNPVPRT